MELYKKAGARYFVAQAMHHDHFFNYATRLNRFNSVDVGPHKDICRMWKDAADTMGLPFGLTEHLAASFSWWNTNKGADQYGPYAGVPYDGNDPEYRDFYYDNQEHVIKDGTPGRQSSMADFQSGFPPLLVDCVKELIETFHPDLLYSDSSLPFEGSNYQPGLEAVACLYNDSIARNGENKAVYTQKDVTETFTVSVCWMWKRVSSPELPKSRGRQTPALETGSMMLNSRLKSPVTSLKCWWTLFPKTAPCCSMSFSVQTAGIDEETRYILKELSKWFSVCAEGVYATRPWRVFGEGDTRVLIQGFTEEKTSWNDSDYRFVTKNGGSVCFSHACSREPCDGH